MKILYRIFLSIVLITSISCTNKIISFNTDKTKKIEVENGQEVLLSFKSTPSAGYKWVLSSKSDTASLQFIKKEINKEQKDIPILGGQVEEVWHFKAISIGKSDLIFYYKRNWENIPPLDSLLYKIKIQ